MNSQKLAIVGADEISQNMRICIIQSCYIPWKGFFDLIGRCDEYVVYDGAQFVKGHSHNRNQTKTESGVKWLTIPVITSDRWYERADKQMRLTDANAISLDGIRLKTRVVRDVPYPAKGIKTERLLGIMRAAGAKLVHFGAR
jgi:hypothetical protein